MIWHQFRVKNCNQIFQYPIGMNNARFPEVVATTRRHPGCEVINLVILKGPDVFHSGVKNRNFIFAENTTGINPDISPISPFHNRFQRKGQRFGAAIFLPEIIATGIVDKI
jgi:hypothetical protein